jgi:Aldo/keto reductase family
MERRTFLKSGVLAAGNATLGTGILKAHAPAEKKINFPAGIPARAFGRTGHTLPVLGMGGSAMVQKLGPLYGVNVLALDQRVGMVRHAYDAGIRYFDTAPAYGESQSI